MMLVYVLRPLPRSAGEPTLILQLASAAFAHSLRARRLTISLSRLAQASLALRPVHLLTHLRGPLSPRLRRVGRPSRLSGSYRAESTIPRAGLSPAASPLVSRHTRKDGRTEVSWIFLSSCLPFKCGRRAVEAQRRSDRTKEDRKKKYLFV